MNQSENQCAPSCPAPRKRISINFNKMTAVLAATVMAWCAATQGAEIHGAAELGDLEKVKAWLSRDPKQIDLADTKGRTVLDCGLLSGKKELVEFLLERGATEDIFAAAAMGHTDKIDGFLKQNPKLLNAKDRSGKAALHWAALYGQRKVVELLLARKADVNLLDEAGFTPLHWAAMFDKSDVVGVLLANKADTAIKVARFGWTPLRLAVIHGNVASAEALLKGGADPNIKDEENIPLLHQAVISRNKAMVELLLANKADVTARDENGETALGEAVEINWKEMAEFLRQHGLTDAFWR
jgi:ankyrin repeat protein